MKLYYKSRYCSTLFHLFGLIWDDLVPFHPRSCLFVLVPVCSSLFRFFVRFNNITLESQASEDSYHEFLFDLYHWITPLNPFRNQGSLSQRPPTSSSAEHHGRSMMDHDGPHRGPVYPNNAKTSGDLRFSTRRFGMIWSGLSAHGIWHVYEF